MSAPTPAESAAPAKVSLPQHDSASKEERATAVSAQCKAYRWTRTGIANASLLEGLPPSENPPLEWQKRFAALRAEVGANDAHIMVRAATSDPAQKSSEPFQPFKDLFVIPKLDVVAEDNQFLRDDIFGWYRIAGPNPMTLSKLEGRVADWFPELTDDVFRGIEHFDSDTISEAEAEARLFTVDYPELTEATIGTFQGTPKKGFVYASRALLAVPKKSDVRTRLLPIAIRCGQDETYPMYTANSKHTDRLTWLAAKLTVQVSDAMVHELKYHLGRTHILLGVMLCAAYRTLPPVHPLFQLLKPHFQGTAFINNLATQVYTNPGGMLDAVTAPPIETSQQLAANAVHDPEFSFNEWMPDKEFVRRGILDAEQLHFPYRDDALKVWNAIKAWVTEYIYSFYKCDSDVTDDYELANWCREVSGKSQGNVHGFGENEDGTIKTRTYLAKAVSMVIFTSSAQHAAIDFPREYLMKFAPAMPLSGYGPAPKDAQPFSSEEELVEQMYPRVENAQDQLNIGNSLSSMKYTRLGDYGEGLKFASSEVQAALQSFREKLDGIGKEIEARNAEEIEARLPPYDYLVPKNIPQSIYV